MTVASADLYKAINAAWDASGLDAVFQAYWPADKPPAQFPVLHDQEASPGQPYPYCVLGELTSNTLVRMSAEISSLREVKDISIRFNVFAEAETGKTAKQVAAELAEEVIKVFGGHPTVAATGTITLDNGKHLITDLMSDFGLRIDDDEYQWVLEYRFRIDVPVAV